MELIKYFLFILLLTTALSSFIWLLVRDYGVSMNKNIRNSSVRKIRYHKPD